MTVIKTGDNQYVLGPRLPTDRVTLVRKVRGMTPEEAQALFDSTSGDVQAFVGFDGVAMIVGPLELVEALDQALSQYESAEHTSYLVQLHVIESRDETLRELSLNAQPLLEVTANTLTSWTAQANSPAQSLLVPLATTSGSSALNGKASLSAMLKATHTDRHSRIVIDPLLCCVLGTQSVHSDQTQYPIRQGTRDAQTGQVDQSVQFIPIGLRVTVEVATVRPLIARLTVRLTDGNVQSETKEGLPITTKREYTSTMDLPTGETVLIGSMRVDKDLKKRGSWFQIGDSREKSNAVWVLFAHVVQVSA